MLFIFEKKKRRFQKESSNSSSTSSITNDTWHGKVQTIEQDFSQNDSVEEFVYRQSLKVSLMIVSSNYSQ